jgi:hypothetical protein
MGKKNSRKSVDTSVRTREASQLWTAGGSLAVAASALSFATPATADFNYTLTGFVRTETTVNAYGKENENNQGGNLFNKQSISRDVYVPPSLQNVVLPGLGVPIPPPGVLKWDSVQFVPFVNDVARRGDDVKSTDNVMNYDIVRVEAELTSELTKDISFTGRIRGVYDPGFYDNFDAHDVSGINGGIVSGVPQLYRGRTNLFQHIVDGGKHPSPLELSGTNYSVDLPTFILAYSHGALSVRAGNQSVAWGQALFFRVMDVPQGLDLRRHLFVDRALEEYADERISSLGIRAGYQVSDEILVDSFINKFQPTILPNTGSPYNVVPAQFTVHDRYQQGGYADKFSYGIRAKAEYGTWGWQAMATRRWNPDGVFRWTQSGVVRPFAGAGFGQVVNNLYTVTPDPTCGRDGANNAGTALSHTGLSVEPAGVYSADEFYKYAADARLNGTDALNHLITDLSSCGTALGASTVDNGSLSQGHAEVDTFTVAAGNSLRGHIERKYFQENVFGLGALYVTSSEKYPFLDQLIFNLEGTFTPNRTFTDIGLSSSFAKRDEASVALIADKWHRFFDGFPGTLIIMQVLWKPTSDLAGRLLSGYGGTQTSLPRGIHNATYLVLGGQQPWPNRIFELEFAALADTHGGIFEQIGLRWNPGHQWHIEGFYNGTQAKLFGANPNSNFMGTLSFIDEFTLRIGHEF